MIKVVTILAIESEKLFNNQLRVRKLGNNQYGIFGYDQNQNEEFLEQGDAFEVANYLNKYFGYIK